VIVKKGHMKKHYWVMADAFARGRTIVPSRDMSDTQFHAGYNRAILELARNYALIDPTFSTQAFLERAGVRQ